MRNAIALISGLVFTAAAAAGIITERNYKPSLAFVDTINGGVYSSWSAACISAFKGGGCTVFPDGSKDCQLDIKPFIHPDLSAGIMGCEYRVYRVDAQGLVQDDFNTFVQNWALPLNYCEPGSVIKSNGSSKYCSAARELVDFKDSCTPNPIYLGSGIKRQAEASLPDLGPGLEIDLIYSNYSKFEPTGAIGLGWSIAPLGRKLVFDVDPGTGRPVAYSVRDGQYTIQLTEVVDGLEWIDDLQGIKLKKSVEGYILYDKSASVIEQYNSVGLIVSLQPVDRAGPIFEVFSDSIRLKSWTGRYVDLRWGDRSLLSSGLYLDGNVPVVNFWTDLSISPYVFNIDYQDGSRKKFNYDDSRSPMPTLQQQFVSELAGPSWTPTANEVFLTNLWLVDAWNPVFPSSRPMSFFGMSGIIDENGIQYKRYRYDDQGRAVGSEAAGGVDRWGIRYETNGSEVFVQSPNGSESLYRFLTDKDIRRLESISGPSGSGCSAIFSKNVYDSSSRISQRVTFSGERRCYVYDEGRNVEVTRLEGLRESEACPADLPSYTIPTNLPPEKAQRKIHTQWHPVWHLKTREAEPKRITTWVYNGQPDPLNNNAVVSCAPADALLPDGSKIAVLCKRYEQATADETGNLGFAAAALSTRSWSSTYNQHGQVLSETDPRGKVTSYEYWADTVFPAGDNNAAGEARGHTLGDLKVVTRPGNQISRHTHYNKRGQVLRTELPNGGVEEREYHLRGWLTKVKQRASATATSSQDTQYDYYPTGLLKQVTQSDGSWQFYEYDDAHRLTDVSDSLGNKVEYTMDNAGNRTDEVYTDAQQVVSKTIRRKFDALGRMSLEQVGAQPLPGPVADGPAFYRSPFGGTRLWKAGRENACIAIDGDPTCTVAEESFDPNFGAIMCKAVCQSGWTSSMPAEGPSCTSYGASSRFSAISRMCESN